MVRRERDADIRTAFGIQPAQSVLSSWRGFAEACQVPLPIATWFVDPRADVVGGFPNQAMPDETRSRPAARVGSANTM
jgi:hypothetical protein